VDYWISDEIVEVIQNHEEYLLINIANVDYTDFGNKYSSAGSRGHGARETTPRHPIFFESPHLSQTILSYITVFLQQTAITLQMKNKL
jgi:hypothetical protein